MGREIFFLWLEGCQALYQLQVYNAGSSTQLSRPSTMNCHSSARTFVWDNKPLDTFIMLQSAHLTLFSRYEWQCIPITWFTRKWNHLSYTISFLLQACTVFFDITRSNFLDNLYFGVHRNVMQLSQYRFHKTRFVWLVKKIANQFISEIIIIIPWKLNIKIKVKSHQIHLYLPMR